MVEAVGNPLRPVAGVAALLRLAAVAMLVGVAAVVTVEAAAGGKGSRLVLGVRGKKVPNRLNAGSLYGRRSSEANFDSQWARSGGPLLFQPAAS